MVKTVPGTIDNLCQEVEEAGKKENASLLSSSVGTGNEEGQCCSKA